MSSNVFTLPEVHPHSFFHQVMAYILFLVAMICTFYGSPSHYSFIFISVVFAYLVGLSVARYNPPGSSSVNSYLAGSCILLFSLMMSLHMSGQEFIYIYEYTLKSEYYIFLLLPFSLLAIYLMRYVFYKECNLR